MLAKRLKSSVSIALLLCSLFGINFLAAAAEKGFEDRSPEIRKRTNKNPSPWKTDFQLAVGQPRKFILDFGNELESLQKQVDHNPKASDSQYMRMRILEGYIALGHYCRFVAHQPKQALIFYQKSDELNSETHLFGINFPWMGAIRIADTYQYDLKDKAATIKYYQKALNDTKNFKQGQLSTDVFGWSKGWLESEITFLKTGEPYSGTIQSEPLSEFTGVIVAMAEDITRMNLVRFETGLPTEYNPQSSDPPSEATRHHIEQVFQGLPNSHFVLASVIKGMSVFYLPTAKSLLDFLKSQDRENYWSGSTISYGYLMYEQKSGTPSVSKEIGASQDSQENFFRKVAELFQVKTGVQLEVVNLKIGLEPQEVLEDFQAAVLKQDIESALNYIYLRKREDYWQYFKSRKLEDIKKTFVTLIYACPKIVNEESPFLECEAIRNENGVDFSYPVHMIKTMSGVWKIDSF